MKALHVRTAIRWRLPADNRNNGAILEKVNEQILSFGSERKLYTFDHVINISDQKEVYDILVEPLVEKSLEGYDCTFLAYGQTGTGKTYTIGLESGGASTNADNNGMCKRALKSIFSCGKAVQTCISFVEIYNDQAFDLLGENPQEAFHRKDRCEPTKKSVQNEHEANAILAQGTKNRHVRTTKMNSTSSRSHAIFTIHLVTASGKCERRKSVINLVDLAGSEGVRKAGTTGKAFAEGKSINESLLAFRRVFAAKSTGRQHTPFRDSLITYILRDSLKVDCYLTLLGCVSPMQTDSAETSSTLQFVAEAKQIKITPRLNAVIDEFQKFNTPVKTLNQTLTSPFRSMKRLSQSITKPNRSSPSQKLINGRQCQSTLVNSNNPQRRFTNTRQSNSNSMAKRASSLSTRRDTRTSSVGIRSTRLSNDAVPSRPVYRKTIETVRSINSNEAFTSSAMDGRFDSLHEVGTIRKSIGPAANEDVLDIVKSLENVIKEGMNRGGDINRAAVTEMIRQLKTRLNVQNSSYDVSFSHVLTTPLIQSAMLSTVAEDTEAVSVKETDTNKSNAKTISSSDLAADPNNLAEQIAFISSAISPVNSVDPVANVSMNYNRMENTIQFIKEEQFNDATTIHSGIQNTVRRDTTCQWECSRKSNSFVETTPNENLMVNFRHESMHRNEDEAIEAMVTSTTIIDSPQLPKRVSDDHLRTPIGKLIIRKVAPACEFECTQYAVETINRTRQPLQVLSPRDYSHFCITPTHTTTKLPMSTAMKKRNPNRDAHRRLPLSPRVVIQRINSPTYRRRAAESRTLAQRNKVTRAVVTKVGEKSKAKPKTIDERQRLLGIINAGSEKDLIKLSRIGTKTAAQIVNYRDKSVD